MVIAADYPFLDVFWTMILFFAWVAWIWIAVIVLTDCYRRHDLSGWGKAGWTILIIVLPFLGVLLYLILNSKDMAERQAQQAKASQAQFDDYVRSVSGTSAAEEVEKAKQLLDSGAINQAEFEALKAKALAS